MMDLIDEGLEAHAESVVYGHESEQWASRNESEGSLCFLVEGLEKSH